MWGCKRKQLAVLRRIPRRWQRTLWCLCIPCAKSIFTSTLNLGGSGLESALRSFEPLGGGASINEHSAHRVSSVIVGRETPVKVRLFVNDAVDCL